jgi:hypothetical protein
LVGLLAAAACDKSGASDATSPLGDAGAPPPLDATTADDPTAPAPSGQDAAADGSTTMGFVHPGLLHTEADFARMRQKVDAGASPWVDGWNRLVANPHASLSWQPSPVAVLYRNDGVHPDNYAPFMNDVAAAYACALRWKVSGDTSYADKVVAIMNAWSSTLQQIAWSNGHYDGFLVAGIQGYQFANAGEIMRGYAGLSSADFDRFRAMMRNVFLPMTSGILTTPSSILVYSSWDLCAMAASLAIGVLCDDSALFNGVLAYFRSGLGNGAIAQTAYYLHPGHLAQTQESGRDQGHDTLSISLLTSLCEMAWNQGVDLYGYDDNRVLAAAEYVAKGNIGSAQGDGGQVFPTMPFARYTNGSVIDTVFAADAQGTVRPEWALVYHHYVNRRGLSAPNAQRFAQLTQPEGGGGDYGPNSGGFDQLGYGTLTFTRDPIAAGAPPSGLMAVVSGADVVLSWWGSAYASSYSVGRATAPAGPFVTVASGIVEPRTCLDSPGPGIWYYVVTASTPAGDQSSSAVRAITAQAPFVTLPFGEGSGNAAGDSSGNGNPGTLNGGVGWTSRGSSGALSFDGSSGFVALPEGFVVDVADFTVATWVYCDDTRASARVFDFGTGLGQYMMLTPRDAAGHVRFAITGNLQQGEQSVSASSPVAVGQWTHLAVTLAGSTCTLYVDGTQAGGAGGIVMAPFRLGRTVNNWLGRSQYASDPYFKGQLGEFRMVRGALSAASVAALFQAG